MPKSRTAMIVALIIGSPVGSALVSFISPKEALAGGVVKPGFAERIRSYYGVSYTEGTSFEFTTESGEGVNGFIMTDLVFSFEQSGAHGLLIRVNGATVFEFFEDFLNHPVHPTPIHFESGIPVPPGATVSVHNLVDVPGHRVFANISGYNF